MNQLPTQQNLIDLHNKIRNTTYKGKESKEGSNADVYTDCEKSEKSEKRVDLPDDLMSTHERIGRATTYCRKHRNNDRLHGKGHARLTRILTRDYLPALDALNTAYPIEQLETERDAIVTRLEKGWQLADSESRARTFAKLLARYEALTDAIDGDVLARHLGRAER